MLFIAFCSDHWPFTLNHVEVTFNDIATGLTYCMEPVCNYLKTYWMTNVNSVSELSLTLTSAPIIMSEVHAYQVVRKVRATHPTLNAWNIPFTPSCRAFNFSRIHRFLAWFYPFFYIEDIDSHDHLRPCFRYHGTNAARCLYISLIRRRRIMKTVRYVQFYMGYKLW